MEITQLISVILAVGLYVCVESNERTKRQASPILREALKGLKPVPTDPPSAVPTVQPRPFTRGPFGLPRPSKPNPPRPRPAPGPKRLSLSRLRRLQKIIQLLIKRDEQLIPNWVQLSFHECFGPNGCNGCLDLGNPANHGLAPTFRLAQLVRIILIPRMSMADFVALLGTEAAKAGAAKAGGTLQLPFSTGRKDCRSPQSDIGLPTGDRTDSIKLLQDQFNLTPAEAVALLGAHSLGRARPQNTGFTGAWDRTETTLDSGYFFVLNSDNLKAERVNNANAKSTQWKNPSGKLMLIADLILRKKFTVSGPFDEPSCGANDVTECPDQPVTAAITREFRNKSKFHTAFSRAFLKMITKTFSSLTRIE